MPARDPAAAAVAPPPVLPFVAATAASPAAQVSPALVTLGAGPPGRRRITLDLAPAELGRVQVQIERSPEGLATVRIAVERADTLQLLRHDQAQLHRALDQAGLPADGRQIDLQFGDANAFARRQDGGEGGGQRPTPGGVLQQDNPAEPAVPVPKLRRFQLRAALDITA